jgi:hypothetical protein
MLIALYAIPVSALLNPVGDWDVWWHIRTGDWIEANGTVPTTDHFSTYGEGRRWYAYSWLFEVLVARLYRHLGLSGILLYRVVLGLALAVAVHALIARREPRFVRATFIAGLALFALTPVLQERSWMFSLLFYVLTLGAVLSLREGSAGRVVWLLPLLYVLGANLHVQFVNGLALLGLACAAPVIDGLLGRVPTDGAATAGTRAWWRLVILTAVCTVATLLNPYHVRLYQAVIELPTQAGVYQLISELLPLSFRFPQDWAILLLFAAAVFTLGRRQRLSAFEVLLLAGSAYLSFRARRDLWCVVLASVVVLVGERPSPPPEEARFPITWRRALAVAAGVAVLMIALGWWRQLTEDHMRKAVADKFPEGAASAIEAEGYKGPLFNTYGWGGYLIWRLRDCKVAIDGRANLHGDERIEESMKTQAGFPVWEDNPDLKAAGYVILPADSPLGQILRRDARFCLVSEDKVAVVFRNMDP